MQIMINIPKEFENHFNSDKFEDSLSRIKVDVLSCITESSSLSRLYEIETLDMLIKAFLRGTPLPKGHGRLKDSVNRADLLKQFEDRFIELQKLKHIKENKSLEDEQLGVNWCINTLKDMPPATSMRKKGKWIGDSAYPICPKCNCNIIEEYISYSDYAKMYKPMNYCPNCGTQMTESEDKK